MQEVTPGTYRHYKGEEYRVLYVATHTETNERLVVYQAASGSEVWARPVAMFLETVDVDGEMIPRFERIG